jgi:TPR repeat protein
MAYDVFISYASEDKIVADAACAMLESHAVRCWIAPRDVIPGMAYGEAIIDAIRGCRIMILIFSSKSNKSAHIPKEIERAVSAGVAVIPFRIEDVKPGKSLDYFIGSVHWLDALTPPLEQHLERLVHNVKTLLSRDEPVIDPKGSLAASAPPAASGAARVAPTSVAAPAQAARSPLLYILLGALTVVAVVFAVLYFARKPSTTAQVVAPAPVSATTPVTSQPPSAEAPQPNGTPNTTPNAGGNAAATAPKTPAAAATPRAPQKGSDNGTHDSARVSPPPKTPASPSATPSTSSEPLYDQGFSAYKSGNLSQAAERYQKSCDNGERQGCNSLGLMYYNGEGVAKDLHHATELFTRACDAKGPGGCLNLGLMYVRGEIQPNDPNRAADFFKRACDGGLPGGCVNLGLLYAKGDGVPQDVTRAAALYTSACDQGNGVSCNLLGLFTEHGRGMPKDLDRAAELFKKSCDAGVQLGCENLERLKDHPRKRRAD